MDLLSTLSTAGMAGALRGWVLLPELRELLEFGGGGVGVGILFVWGCQGRGEGLSRDEWQER